MSNSLISQFKLESQPINAYHLGHDTHQYVANDYRCLNYFDEFLKKIDPSNILFIFIRSPKTNNYNSESILPIEPRLGPIAIFLAYILSHDYNGRIQDAWFDGVDLIISKIQAQNPNIEIDDAIKVDVDIMIKKLYPVNQDLLSLAYLFDDKCRDMERAITVYNEYLRSHSGPIASRLNQRKILEVNRFLNDINRVRLSTKSEENISEKCKQLMDFYKSESLFSFNQTKINALIEELTVEFKRFFGGNGRSISYAREMAPNTF